MLTIVFEKTTLIWEPKAFWVDFSANKQNYYFLVFSSVPIKNLMINTNACL